MRDRETIDSELRLIALHRRSILEQGGQPSSQQLDELLDERLGHRPASAKTAVLEARENRAVAPRRATFRRKGLLLRFGPLAVLPLSLIAVAAVCVVMFATRSPAPAAQPEAAPPSSAPPAPPAPAAPRAQAPPADIVDTVFIDVLKRNGVPVPSNEYATTHGHAVCDFLANRPNLTEAIGFVQRTTVWDATQSANFTAGAVVSYCPQYEGASVQPMQPAVEGALTDMQNIDRDLQRIQGDLQGIERGLPALPGQG